MSKKNFLTGREKELQLLADQYESCKKKGESFYADAEDLADLCDWYATRRGYDKAQEVVKFGLHMHPNSTSLLIEKAYLYLDTMEKEKAKQIAEQLKHEYDDPEVIILKATLALAEGNKAEADLIIDTIDEKNFLPNIIDVAYMYLDAGYPQEAWKWIKEGEQKYMDQEGYIAITADYYHATQEYDTAIKYYNMLIDKNPYSASYWMGVARCYYEKNECNKAIEACDYAIIADGDYSEAYALKGHAFFALENYEEAFKLYRQAEAGGALSPGFTYSAIGVHHYEHKRWEEAMVCFEKVFEVIKQYPHEKFIPFAIIYPEAGYCLHKLGHNEEKHKVCQKAFGLDPRDPYPYLIDGRIYLEDEDHQNGLKMWAKALALDPSADTWNDIASYSMEMGYIDYAKQALEQIKTIDPDYNGINEQLTTLYLILNDEENFKKYNKLCKNPFSEEMATKIKESLNYQSEEEQINALKELFRNHSGNINEE